MEEKSVMTKNLIGEYWHLCSPGELSGILFKNTDDYIFGMNLVALCAGVFKNDVSILTFQLMSNHVHFIMRGSRESVERFFEEFRKRLSKYMAQKGYSSDCKGFTHNIFRIEDEIYLRNSIAYVNRNGYLVNKDYTPFSYPWGSNRYFFNLTDNNTLKVKIGKKSIRERKSIFHTHFNEFPENYYFVGKYISPMCYIAIDEANRIFKDAHHYLNSITRRVETYGEIAKQLEDRITYTDEEILNAIYSLSYKKFNTSPKGLDKMQKIDIAKELHFNYNACNKQIKRVLRIDEEIINELFPDKIK